MPRYIDADALMAQLNRKKAEPCNKRYTEGFNDALMRFRSMVHSAPTVSPDDVRGVVRCKDCKWCHAGYCEKYDDLIPWGCANKPWEDWFCADGKRREAKKEAQDAD